MSEKRVCDLDNTQINPEVDEFFTVTDGRTGKAKDICVLCARSRDRVQRWTATTALELGDRVFRTGNAFETLVYDVISAGVTGATEPTWPSLPGDQLEDGTVIYRTAQAPRGLAVVYYQIPGSIIPEGNYSMWGWMTEDWADVDV